MKNDDITGTTTTIDIINDEVADAYSDLKKVEKVKAKARLIEVGVRMADDKAITLLGGKKAIVEIGGIRYGVKLTPFSWLREGIVKGLLVKEVMVADAKLQKSLLSKWGQVIVADALLGVLKVRDLEV